MLLKDLEPSMKMSFANISAVTAAMAIAILSGCAAPSHGPRGMMRGDMSSGEVQSQSGERASPMSRQAMCDMHRNMNQASPTERQAMMRERMGNMTPEQMEQQMQRMRAMCM